MIIVRRYPFLAVAATLGVMSCDRIPTEPTQQVNHPRFMMMPPHASGGAEVLNSGMGKPDVFCFFGEFTTEQGTAVVSPSGNAVLSCHFDDLPPLTSKERQTDWLCTLNLGGIFETRQSVWKRTKSGQARITCHFNDKPLVNAIVISGGSTLSAQEAAFTKPLEDFPAAELTGQVVSIGLACNGFALDNDPTGAIALIERGSCRFDEKVTNAMSAGAIGAVVYNNVAGGDAIIRMDGTPVPIPAVFVGRTDGLNLVSNSPVLATLASCGNSMSCRGHLP